MKNNKAKIIEANNKLIAFYSQYPADSIPPRMYKCPLCTVAADIADRANRFVDVCDVCPWVFFEGKSCVQLKYFYQTAEQRIARLQGWNKKLGVKS